MRKRSAAEVVSRMDPYRRLAAAVAGDDIRCQFQSAGQLVVSAQVCPVWPDRGNSFWVTYTGGRWYLFTWSPVGYRVPKNADVARLCRVCMAHGPTAMSTVPAQVAQEFGLCELSDDEAEAVYAEMGNNADGEGVWTG